jgi:hypothetical protein
VELAVGRRPREPATQCWPGPCILRISVCGHESTVRTLSDDVVDRGADLLLSVLGRGVYALGWTIPWS